jgi:hypothetical protein
MRDFWIEPHEGQPMLLLGYGQIAEPAIPASVAAVAEAVRAGRSR